MRLGLALRRTVLASVIGIAAACSSGSDTPAEPPAQQTPPPPISVRRTIGVAGGSVSDAQGRVSLEIPPGALSSDVSISIDEVTSPPSGAVPGAFFEFGPSGTQFALPVRMTVRYDQAKLPSGMREDSLVLAKRHTSGTWELKPTSLDTAQNRISGEIASFSTIGVWCCWQAQTLPPTLQATYGIGRVVDLAITLNGLGPYSPNVRIEWARTGGPGVPPIVALKPPLDSDFQPLVTLITQVGAAYTHPAGSIAEFYWYRVRYVEANGNLGTVSAPPARVTILGLPAAPPAVDSIWVTNVSSNGADLHFLPIQVSPTVSVDGYRIRRRLLPSGAFTVVADLTQSSPLPFPDRGLVADSPYEYRVDAYNVTSETIGRSVQTRTLPGTVSCAVRLTTPPLNVSVGTHWGTGLIVTRRGLTGTLVIRIAEDSGASAFRAIAINPPQIPPNDSIAGAVFQTHGNLVFGTTRIVVTAEEVGIGSCSQAYYVTVGVPSITLSNTGTQPVHLVIAPEQPSAGTLVPPSASRSVVYAPGFRSGSTVLVEAYDNSQPPTRLGAVNCRFPALMPTGGQFTVEYRGGTVLACTTGW